MQSKSRCFSTETKRPETTRLCFGDVFHVVEHVVEHMVAKRKDMFHKLGPETFQFECIDALIRPLNTFWSTS